MPLSPKASDLCLVSEVADDLGVSTSDRLQRIVSAASEAIAAYCSRTFERGTVTDYPASSGRPLLILSRPPIATISEITEGDETVDPDAYEAIGQNAAAGLVLHKSGVWGSTQRLDGAAVSDTVADSQGQSDKIAATYVGGYVTPGQNALDSVTYPTVTLPDAVREAAIQTATAIVKLKGSDPNVKSESIGDWSISFFDAKNEVQVIPAYARALLAPYRLGFSA